MRTVLASDAEAVARLVTRDEARDPEVEQQAARIVADVQARGDAALAEWTAKLDGNAGKGAGRSAEFAVGPREMKAAWGTIGRDVQRAIQLAARHLAKVASKQVPRGFVAAVAPGLRVEQRVRPLARVGCYVPGGRYPLPSTLLMTVIPARVAGVKDVVVACPRPSPVVLAAALEAGADRVLAIGGAQAIAALAYGTASIPRVDKIVGPGNAWVTAAKALVAADCAIDMRAGPSEIVVASNRGNPAWIAADLLAQAEHDPAARAILVTSNRRLATRVAAEIEAQMPSAGPASVSIERNGAIVISASAREAVAIVNRLAPEHLVVDEDMNVEAYTAAGTIFVGRWSVQAAGDYCTGSNHVLPTGGAARFRGGLNAADFVRVYTVQTLTERGIRTIGPAVVALAEAEGLTAHAASVKARLGGPASDVSRREGRRASRSR